MIAATAPIKDYMTQATIGIDADLTLADAKARMANERIRHLPVLRDGRLIGILSARDVILMESLPDIEPSETPVQSAMVGGNLRTCAPDSPIRDALQIMVEHGIGAVPIVEDGQLSGIFTDVDAAKVLLNALV